MSLYCYKVIPRVQKTNRRLQHRHYREIILSSSDNPDILHKHLKLYISDPTTFASVRACERARCSKGHCNKHAVCRRRLADTFSPTNRAGYFHGEADPMYTRQFADVICSISTRVSRGATAPSHFFCRSSVEADHFPSKIFQLEEDLESKQKRYSMTLSKLKHSRIVKQNADAFILHD